MFYDIKVKNLADPSGWRFFARYVDGLDVDIILNALYKIGYDKDCVRKVRAVV